MTPPSTVVSDPHEHRAQARDEVAKRVDKFYNSLYHRPKFDHESFGTLERGVATLLLEVMRYVKPEPVIRKGHLRRHNEHARILRDKVIEAFSFDRKRDDRRQSMDSALNRRLGKLWQELVQTQILLVQLEPEPTSNLIIGPDNMRCILELSEDEQLSATGSDGLLSTTKIEGAFTHDLRDYISTVHIFGPDFLDGSAHKPALGTLPIRTLRNPSREGVTTSSPGFHRRPSQKRPSIKLIVPATPPRFRSRSVPNSRQGSRAPQRRTSISPSRRQRTPSPLRYLLPSRLRASALPAPLSDEQRKAAREAGWSSPPVTKPTYMRDPAPDAPSARTPPGKGEHPRDWILNYKLASDDSKTRVYTAPLPTVQRQNIAGHMTEQIPASAHQPRSGHAR